MMEKNFDKGKFKRLTHSIRIVLQAFYWADIVAGVLCLLGFIALQFIPGEYLTASENSGFSLTLNGLIRYGVESDNINVGTVYKSITIMAALLSVGIAYFLRQLNALMKNVEEGRPFEIENSNRLKVMGFLLLLYSFVLPGADMLVASSMVHAFDIDNISVVYSVNISLLISGFVILILAGIFQYGSYLQSEYDTTL